MQVKEIMTESPACCLPDANLKEVSKMMIDNDCGCIPVVENFKTMKPVGTITDRDITVRTVAAGKNPLDLKVSDVMTTDIKTVQPETSVVECGNVMKENGIRRVLVVDNAGKCCGIVAQADIAENGSNPNLVSNVVQDISEAAPTPIESASGETGATPKGKQKSSLFGLNTVVPLAVGVAAGAAYKFLTTTPAEPKDESVEKYGEAQLTEAKSNKASSSKPKPAAQATTEKSKLSVVNNDAKTNVKKDLDDTDSATKKPSTGQSLPTK